MSVSDKEAAAVVRRDRVPANYALLREIIEEAGPGGHQTASDIYALARKRRPTLGFATVHRGLARLAESGDILKIDLPDGRAAWYEAQAPAHAHLICNRCDAIVDVAYATPARDLQTLAARAAVQIAAETITFRGLCGACLQSAAAADAVR